MITTLNLLEELRSKEELVNYFKEIGENVTDEEIEKLKAKYEKIEQNKSHLSMKQLDEVAGGSGEIVIHEVQTSRSSFIKTYLSDGTILQKCWNFINPNSKSEFVKFGDRHTIDLSAVGRGHYAVEIITHNAAQGDVLDDRTRNYPIYIGHRTACSLRDFSIMDHDLYQAIFEYQGDISFVETSSLSIINTVNNVTRNLNQVPSKPEPHQAARLYLENLIAHNDNPV